MFSVIDQYVPEWIITLSLCVSFQVDSCISGCFSKVEDCVSLHGAHNGRDCEREVVQQTFKNVYSMPLSSVNDWVSPPPVPPYCNSINVIGGTLDTATVHLQPLYPVAPRIRLSCRR
jgi:hypothetical protein